MPLPPFYDLQVNGYTGVDFNQDDLTPEALDKVCHRLQHDHVAGILATVITDTLDRMKTRLANLARCREQSPVAKQLIKGIHIEGPFLSPVDGYRGAHPKDAILPPIPATADQLLDAAAGLTKLVTLAPECDPTGQTTRHLASKGILVSAGHTNASTDDLTRAIDNGLSLFTHLGNACPMNVHRHDNIIQRALALRDRLTIMFIADLTHVPLPALRNYLDLTGYDRALVVTDAIAPASLGPGRYTLGRWELLIEDDMVARAPDRSHFVGSAITMPQTYANLTQKLHLSPENATKLASTNSAKMLGLPHV